MDNHMRKSNQRWVTQPSWICWARGCSWLEGLNPSWGGEFTINLYKMKLNWISLNFRFQIPPNLISFEDSLSDSSPWHPSFIRRKAEMLTRRRSFEGDILNPNFIKNILFLKCAYFGLIIWFRFWYIIFWLSLVELLLCFYPI